MIFNIEKIETFTGHKDSIFALASSNSASKFYSGSADGYIIEWNIDQPDLSKPLARISNSCYALLHSKTPNYLWIGDNFEGIHLLDLEKKAEIANVYMGKKSIFDIKETDNFVFVADNSGMVSVIDKQTYKIINQIKLSNESARCLAISEKKNELAVGFSDNSIKILNLDNFEQKYNLTGHKNSVFSIQYLPNNRLVSTARDAHIRVWNGNENNQLLHDIPAHLFAINHIIFIESKNILVSCSMDKSIKIWDADSLKLLKVIDKARFAGHGTSINRLLWNQQKQVLLSASDDRSISMWKLF